MNSSDIYKPATGASNVAPDINLQTLIMKCSNIETKYTELFENFWSFVHMCHDCGYSSAYELYPTKKLWSRMSLLTLSEVDEILYAIHQLFPGDLKKIANLLSDYDSGSLDRYLYNFITTWTHYEV